MLAALILGIVTGAITGIFPGLGLTATLIILYSFLSFFSPAELLVFYITLICSVQYFGSVVGIYLGVPGEINSLIASRTGFAFMHKNLGSLAIGSTAIASFFSATIGILVFYFAINHSHFLLPLLSVKIQWVILASILIFLCFNNSSGKIYSLIFVSSGILLSCIGFNHAGISITFNTEILVPGLNASIVLLMLYIIPNLLKYYSLNKVQTVKIFDFKFKESFGWCISRWDAIIRGTSVGCVSGLIPGIGPIVCNNIAGMIEKKINPTKKTKELIAAESANNSAILIALIPFMSLGLIILPHEAVIYDLLINQGIAINVKWLEQKDVLETIVYYALGANILAFLVAWPASRMLVFLYSLINYKRLVQILLLIIISITFYQSYGSLRLNLDIFSILFLLPATILIIKKRLDTLPLIFSYLIGDQTVRSTILLYNIL